MFGVQNYFKRETPPAFQPPATDADDLLGKGFAVDLDKEDPISDIIVDVSFIASTAFGTLTADGPLALINDLKLYCAKQKKSFNVVDVSGPFAIEYAQQLNGTLDRWTNSLLAECNKATPTVQVAAHRLRYWIPLCHPLFDGPLELLGCLDAHEHKAKPQLKIKFGNLTDCGATGAVSDFRASVFTARRRLTDEQKSALAGKFLDFDIVENLFQAPLSTASRIEVPINGPGKYAALMLRHYLGGATITRSDISGAPTATGVDETLWSLKVGNETKDEFTMHLLQCVNDWSRTTDSGRGPQVGQTLAAATQGHGPHSVLRDYLSDGGKRITKLTTLLDLDTPTKLGKNMYLSGTCASVATNASKLYYGGHRYYDVPAELMTP